MGELNPLKLLCFKTRDDIIDLISSKQIKSGAQLFAIFRMPKKKSEFQVPMQGYYIGHLSSKAKEAWIKNRSVA